MHHLNNGQKYNVEAEAALHCISLSTTCKIDSLEQFYMGSHALKSSLNTEVRSSSSEGPTAHFFQSARSGCPASRATTSRPKFSGNRDPRLIACESCDAQVTGSASATMLYWGMPLGSRRVSRTGRTAVSQYYRALGLA